MRAKGVFLAMVLTLVASACGSRLPDRVLARIDGQQAVARAGPSAQQAIQDQGSAATATATTAVASGPASVEQRASSGPRTTGPQQAAGPAGGPAAPGAAAVCKPSSQSDKGVTPSEIKVASIVTDSGPLPGATAGTYRGAAAYFAMINAQGGVCGRKITILKGDDALDPARARSEFERLEPQVLAFVGNLAVADSGYLDLLQSTGVPYLSPTVDPSGRGYPNVWWKSADNYINTTPFAYMKKANPGVQKVGYLLSAVNGVRVNSPATEAAIQHVGFDIVYRAEADVTAPDYTAHIVKMRDSGVQFVYLFAFEINMQARLARNMRQQNWEPQVKVGLLAYNTRFFSLLGDAAEGWKSYMEFLPVLDPGEAQRSQAMAQFQDWNRRVFPNDQVDLFPATGWAQAAYFVQVLQKVGPVVTRQKLLEALATVDSTDRGGIWPPLNPKTGLMAQPCAIVVKATGGRWVREDPPDQGWDCTSGDEYKWR